MTTAENRREMVEFRIGRQARELNSRGYGPRLWLAVFVVLQVADGLMTYVAVGMFGPQAEGNPLLVTWMAMLGYGPALVGAKTLACACGAILYTCGV